MNWISGLDEIWLFTTSAMFGWGGYTILIIMPLLRPNQQVLTTGPSVAISYNIAWTSLAAPGVSLCGKASKEEEDERGRKKKKEKHL